MKVLLKLLVIKLKILKCLENINIQAAYIHIIGDIIQSIGVVIAAIIIMINPEWTYIDPVCTFLFSVIVLFTTVNVTKRCLNILMEGSPLELNVDEIKRKLKLKVIILNYLFILTHLLV